MKLTHIEWVYLELAKGKTLTPLIAMNGCGTMRLAAIVYELRERGINIRTTPVKRKGESSYASYKMVKGKTNGKSK